MIRICLFFFFNDTATTEIYTLSLHDALPISDGRVLDRVVVVNFQVAAALDFEIEEAVAREQIKHVIEDRKSTRLNSSHANISYAVFCLKKKKINPILYFLFFPNSLCIIHTYA